MEIWVFCFGVVVGIFFGWLVLGLCVAAGKMDDAMLEEAHRREKRGQI